MRRSVVRIHSSAPIGIIFRESARGELCMRFVPHFSDGRPFSQPLGKIVCVGRNYAEHARELDNPVPSAPLLFIKPATSAVSLEASIAGSFDRGDVHFETELALLIGETLRDSAPDAAAKA